MYTKLTWPVCLVAALQSRHPTNRDKQALLRWIDNNAEHVILERSGMYPTRMICETVDTAGYLEGRYVTGWEGAP